MRFCDLRKRTFPRERDIERGHTRSCRMTCSGRSDEDHVLFRSGIEMSAAAFRTKRDIRFANAVKYRQDDFYPERIIYLHSRTSDRSGKNRRTPEGAHLGTGADDGRIRNLQRGGALPPYRDEELTLGGRIVSVAKTAQTDVHCAINSQ